jgi:hypothetical protein
LQDARSGGLSSGRPKDNGEVRDRDDQCRADDKISPRLSGKNGTPVFSVLVIFLAIVSGWTDLPATGGSEIPWRKPAGDAGDEDKISDGTKTWIAKKRLKVAPQSSCRPG